MTMFLLAFVFGSAKIAQSLRAATNVTYRAEINWGQACFGARGSSPGEFTVPSDTTVTSIVLEHVSGYVACSEASTSQSNWGCQNGHWGTFMTDASNQIIFPTSDTAGMTTYGTRWYYMDGSAGYPQDATLTWAQPASVTIPAGQYRLWYGEDLMSEPNVGGSEGDNGGTTCATIKAYGSDSGASATGDPHLQNVHGERFDLMKPGNHVLINIPRGELAEKALLRVQAEAKNVGGSCGDMYFEEVNITGSWAEAKQAGGYHHSLSHVAGGWIAFGEVELKVVKGHTQSGIEYLNVYVKHLGRAGFPVGGLLGEDDHQDEAVAPVGCLKQLQLSQAKDKAHSPGYKMHSTAEAFLE